MYHKYFGLKEAPFSIAPNPRYLFMSRRHKEALAHLLYGVNHGGGFVLLTGEVGTGKTTVSRALLRQLPKNTDIAYVLNPTLDSAELLATICDELAVTDIDNRNSLKELSDKLHDFLLSNHAAGRNTVLIIDEAQHLDYKVMEQIRLLTNLETDEKKLLQIVFIGQPELNQLLAKPELRQLAQRITARFHIEPLTLAETSAYIRHRLLTAGMQASQTLFNKGAVNTIYKLSGGIPRLINVTCDRALLGAYTQGLPSVTTELAKDAALEASPTAASSNNRIPLAIAAGLAVTISALLIILLASSPGDGEPAATLGAGNGITQSGTVVRVTQAPGQPLADANNSPGVDTNNRLMSLLSISLASQSGATNRLQQALEVFPGQLQNPCQQLISFGVACLDDTLRSWGELTTYNRPAVLSLDINGSKRYLAVVGVSDDKQLQIVDEHGQLQLWPMFVLGQYWDGGTQLLWQPPPGYEKLLKPNERSPFVRWVANSFATLDQQPQPLAEFEYNDVLRQRVMLFQANQNINADGLVGDITVMKINDALATDFSLASAALKGQ